MRYQTAPRPDEEKIRIPACQSLVRRAGRNPKQVRKWDLSQTDHDIANLHLPHNKIKP